jgi:uncharacterized membrane protein|tara:strand:+ start:624 stop:839 length:216 start_codon:yes stop_codon:yes gene_type:complete
MTKLEQLQQDKEELIVKLHIYQDKSIIDQEIIETLKEKNKFLKQEMTKLQLEISTNINKIHQFNQNNSHKN